MSRRTAVLVSASVLVPIAGMLLVVAAEALGLDMSELRGRPWFGWLIIALLVSVGVTCLLRLGWPLRHRLVITAVYAPVMTIGLVAVLLVSACAMLSECL